MSEKCQFCGADYEADCLINQLAAATKRADELAATLAEREREDERFLLHLVDVVWGEAFENESVPATDYAQRMIAKARKSLTPTPEAAQAERQPRRNQNRD